MIQDWILKHHRELKLEIEVFQWPKELGLSIFDIEVHIEYDGIMATGRSVDGSEDSANLKALAESIERWALHKYKQYSSNGLATHTDLKQAQLNARNELLERDSFLCHYLTKTAWHSADQKILENNQIYLLSQANDFQIQIGWKKTFLNQIVAIALAKNITQKESPLTKGFCLGLACHLDLDFAINKAFNELTMALGHALTHGKSNPMNLDQFNSLKDWGPDDHGKLALHRDNQNQYMLMFEFTGAKNTTSHNLTNSEDYTGFEFKTFELPTIFEPFKVVQAINPKLQNLYFGPTLMSNLNISRLRNFKDISISELNFFPHPLA